MVMMPLNQIAVMRPEPEGVRIVTTAGANDPMLVLRAQLARRNAALVQPAVRHAVLPGVDRRRGPGPRLRRRSAFILRDIRAGPFTRRDALWFAALLLTVVWAKLTLLQHYPVPVPFWDQWDGEALTLYIPWADGGVTWRQMFTFHNEHRIFFSRLLALTLLVVNGQWDPHLQIVVNASLHSLAALVFAGVPVAGDGRR